MQLATTPVPTHARGDMGTHRAVRVGADAIHLRLDRLTVTAGCIVEEGGVVLAPVNVIRVQWAA